LKNVADTLRVVSTFSIDYLNISGFFFLFAHNEIFFPLFLKNENVFLVIVRYIDPSENAAKFKYKVFCFVFVFCGAATQRGPWPHSSGFLITHNGASQSVGHLWTSDQLVAETFT